MCLYTYNYTRKEKMLKSVLVLSLLLLTGVACSEEANQHEVSFSDNQKALINPDMGWVAYFYSNEIKNYGSKLAPSDSLDWFEGCSTVYFRLPWAFIEPEEGVYNWAVVDTAAQRWIAAGKKVAFRFTCCEMYLPFATPKWVEDAGAKMIRFNYNSGRNPNGWLRDPVYDDPIYLAKLEQFLAEAGKRYNGNPNVAFIDIGTFGLWGEGHTIFSSGLNQEETDRIVKIHADLHLKHFPDTQLCISDDVAGHCRPGSDFPSTDYCLSKGITLRDDSILVQAPPRCWYHSELAQKFWPTMPVILESGHYKECVQWKTWNSEKLLESVEQYHASYMSIHSFPEDFYKDELPIIRRINLRLGYRLLPKIITYPKTVKIGERFDVSSVWSNVAVAPCYPGGYWTLTLKDEKNGIVAVLVDEKFNFRDLKVGAANDSPETALKSTFCVGLYAPVTKPGDYDVWLSVGTADGTPVFALPIDAPDDGQRRYKIGTIRLRD